MMQPLVDSSKLMNDPLALRERSQRDGYLFLKGVLAKDLVLAIAAELAEIMAAEAWIEPNQPLAQAKANLEKFCVEPQPAFMQVFYQQLSLKSMHALRMHNNILAIFAALFDETPFPLPHFVMRMAFPDRPDYATPAHQDFVHFEGSRKNWALWLPFTPIDTTTGGLAVAAGSHLHGPYDMRPALGAGQMVIDADLDSMDWRWSPMQPGDILLHNCLTVHKGLPNNSTVMRVSVDFRYQPLSEPVGEKGLGVAHQMKTWEELYQGWDGDEYKYYWHDLNLQVEPFTYYWYDRRDQRAIEMGEAGDQEALVALQNIMLKHRDAAMRKRAQQALSQLQSRVI